MMIGTLAEAAPLTPRESDVLRLIARGYTYAQVANRLGVSVHTVTSHIKSTYRKLGVRSGAAAVMRAAELSLFAQNVSGGQLGEPSTAS
jgi:DNA-binding CsgD family transcriptional regulator